MGSYIASDRSIAAARASGAQHRSMNPTQSLEKAADAFLQAAKSLHESDRMPLDSPV